MVKRLKAFCQKRPFVCIAALAIPLFLAATAAKLVMGRSKALFVSDGFYYYAYTVSLVLDQDVNFANQYQFNQGLANRGLMKIVPQTGYPENMFAIGAGLVWLPSFFVTHLIVMLLKAIGLPLTTTGFEVYYQLPTYLWSFAVGLVGMWLTYRLLRDFSGDSQLAGWVVATLLFGTTLSHYAFIHCNFPHWVSTAAVALCLWTLFPLMQNPERSLRWFFAGLALGGGSPRSVAKCCLRDVSDWGSVAINSKPSI